MKTMLLIAGAASLMGGESLQPPVACPAPSAGAASSNHTRFDPIVLDLKGDGVATAGQVGCGHTINVKEVSPVGRAAADHAINTKGTGAAGRSASAATDPNEGCGDTIAKSEWQPGKSEMAINCKGTGVAGRAAAGPGGDCDDTSDGSDGRSAIEPTKTQMAIKCKGTGAQ